MKMKRIVPGILLVICIVVLGIAISGPGTTRQYRVAVRSAEAWLHLVDMGAYAESWDVASKELKERVDRGGWARRLQRNRSSLGRMLDRQELATEPMDAVAERRDTPLLVIHYQTRYEQTEIKLETVTCVRGLDGRWRVLDYVLN